MSDSFRLEHNLEQRQILAPQLIQQLKILTLNNLELYQYLKTKEEENPFLVVEENFGNKDEFSNTPVLTFKEDEPFTNKIIKKVVDNINIKQVFENTVTNKKSLFKTLQDNFQLYETSLDERFAAENLIFYLKSTGLLRISLKNLSKILEIPYNVIENGKIFLQSIDGMGIGSESYKEMILVQVHLGNFDKNGKIYNFILKYWDDFITNNWKKISEKKEFTIKEINEIKKILQDNINFNPLSDYDSGGIEYLIPDITVKKSNDGFIVKFNNFFNIKLEGVSKKFKIKDKTIKDKIEEVKQIKNAIKQRENILKKFMEYFILYQQNFFLKGPRYIESISQKEFAKKIGISESTISRIVSNKYIQTDFGIYPLKMFFDSVKNKKSGENAEEFSRSKVLNAIKEIIESEDKQSPYSDSQISKLLKEKGFNIARRTISKYREMLGIPSARIRKKLR